MIYFIQDTGTGAIKIGVSSRPAKRMRDLQVAHATPLILLAVMDGGREEEAHIHQLFSRLSGEWFRPASDLFAYIQARATILSPHDQTAMRVVVVPSRRRYHKELTMSKGDQGAFIDFLEQSGLDQMTDEQLVDFLASQQAPAGGYRHSEQKIITLMGGNAVAVLAQIRAARNGDRSQQVNALWAKIHQSPAR